MRPQQCPRKCARELLRFTCPVFAWRWRGILSNFCCSGCLVTQPSFTPRNRLSGHIPGAVASFLSLTELEVGKNSISGSLPDGLSTLQNMYSLGVDRNDLEGALHGGRLRGKLQALRAQETRLPKPDHDHHCNVFFKSVRVCCPEVAPTPKNNLKKNTETQGGQRRNASRCSKSLGPRLCLKHSLRHITSLRCNPRWVPHMERDDVD